MALNGCELREQASTAVNRTVVTALHPTAGVPLAGKSLVIVTGFEQVSVAVAPALELNHALNPTLMFPEHSCPEFDGGLVKVGEVVSRTVKVAVVWTAALLQLSVARKVTVLTELHPLVGAGPALFDHTTAVQASVAAAPPLLATQVLYAVSIEVDPHSMVCEAAGVVRVGPVLSNTVKVPVVEEENPHKSVTVKVTGNALLHPPETTPVKSSVQTKELSLTTQASVATAPPWLFLQLVKA